MTATLTEADDRPATTPADEAAFLARCVACREAKQSAASVRKPSAATIARRYVQVDVIAVEPNQHGLGWTGYACEIGFARTEFRNHLTLLQFASPSAAASSAGSPPIDTPSLSARSKPRFPGATSSTGCERPDSPANDQPTTT